MLRLTRSAIITIGSTLVLSGCREETSSTGATVTDSAGVRIVSHTAGVWEGGRQWRLAESPFLRIGSVNGEPEYLFGSIAGIALVSDTLVVVSDGESNALRWYDLSGRFLFDRGGSGQGPGEFTRVGAITVGAGDTVVAVDWANARATRFSSAGETVGTHDLSILGGVPGAVHRLTDGSFVTGMAGLSSSQLGEWQTLGLYRHPSPIVRIDPSGARADTIDLFPGLEILIRDQGWGRAPFGKALHFAAGGERVYVGTAERFQIEGYGTDGRLLLSIRAPGVDLELTPAEIQPFEDQVRERMASRSAEEKAAAERELLDLVYPETRPAYGSLLLDDEGNLWVGEHLEVVGEEPRHYVVFDREGNQLARIAIPASFQPMAVANRRILGRFQDSMGVEYVEGYKIEMD